MSENGPREGTRDLPKRDRDAGHRAIEPGTPAGEAYAALGRAARRRREALLDLVRQGLSASRIAEVYRVDHPLEPVVTHDEVRALTRRG
jgi:hypothetical protein